MNLRGQLSNCPPLICLCWTDSIRMVGAPNDWTLPLDTSYRYENGPNCVPTVHSWENVGQLAGNGHLVRLALDLGAKVVKP